MGFSELFHLIFLIKTMATWSTSFWLKVSLGVLVTPIHKTSRLAQPWPVAFALKQGKLFCRAHSHRPSHNRRPRLRGKGHLTGVLP